MQPTYRISGESPNMEAMPLLGFEVNDEKVRGFFYSLFPQELERLLGGAGKILEHRFDLLGYEGLKFGDEIDWCLEPITKKRIPLSHWSKIARMPSGKLGDLKIVWELNRHQHLVLLGQAYFLTKDHRYADEIVNQVLHWPRENPPGIGANWASSLEVAFRVISWIWAVRLIKGIELFDKGFSEHLAKSIGEHASHIERFLSTYESPNTHLTGEALGLFYAGVFFPNLPEAARWRKKGEDILFKMLPVHILPDGGYVERTLWYHEYTISFYIHFFILLKKLGSEIPDWAWTRVEEAVSFLMYSLSPDRTIPLIGDDDGGFFLPLSTGRFNDARGLLAVASVLFKRGDFKSLSVQARPEVLWLLGIQGAEAYHEIVEKDPKEVSKGFKETGYFFLRSGWGAQANYMAFDCGPHGWLNGGHAHADLLSILVYSGAEPIVADPGTFSYSNDGGWRDLFRGPKMHSTVLVNKKHPAVAAGPFHWRSIPKHTFRGFFSNSYHDYVAGSMPLDEETEFTREIHYIKPDLFLIIDRIKGKGGKHIETRFPLGHGGWALSGLECWKMESPNGCSVISLKTEGMSASLEPSWVSAMYGRKEHATTLVFNCRSPLPAEMAYLIVLSRLKVKPDFALHRNSFELHLGREHWIGFGTHHGLGFDAEEKIATDSKSGLLKLLPSGETTVLALHEGTYIRINGKAIS